MRYSDLAPYLSKQFIMTSNVNNAATMSVDDYFTTNSYKGKIYKTNNLLGKTLAQVVGGDTTKLTKEQKRIDDEIEALRRISGATRLSRTRWTLSLNSTRRRFVPCVRTAAARCDKDQDGAPPRAPHHDVVLFGRSCSCDGTASETLGL